MKFYRLFTPLFFLFLLTACSSSSNVPASTSDPSTSPSMKQGVQGTVVGPWNGTYGNTPDPISGADVTYADGDGQDASVTTDSEGQFEIELSAGTHHLKFSKTGLRRTDLEVIVKDNEVTTLTTPGDTKIVMHSSYEAKAKWTVMYYMAVSNNLYYNSGRFWHGVSSNETKLEGMYAFKSQNSGPAYYLQEDVNIIVFYDRQLKDNADQTSAPDLRDSPYFRPPGTYLTSINKVGEKINFNTVPWKGGRAKIDSGNVETLKEFVKMVYYHYPADKYMLVMYDHGFGINGLNESNKIINEKGDIVKPYTRMQLPEFGKTIRELTALNPIEIVAFDNCLMGMFEVAYELGPSVHYMVAAETEILAYNLPVGGMFTKFWNDYCRGDIGGNDCGKFTYQFQDNAVIKWLTNITDRDPRETARLLAYEADAVHYEMDPPQLDGGDPHGEVYAALDLNEFRKTLANNGYDGTAELFKKLASKQYNNFMGNKTQYSSFLDEVKQATQNMSGRKQSNRFYEDSDNPREIDNYRDLKHFSENLSMLSGKWGFSSVIDDEARALSLSLESANLSKLDEKKSILYNSIIRPAPPAGNFHGLSVLLTTALFSARPYQTYYNEYKNLQIYKDCPEMWNFLYEWEKFRTGH